MSPSENNLEKVLFQLFRKVTKDDLSAGIHANRAKIDFDRFWESVAAKTLKRNKIIKLKKGIYKFTMKTKAKRIKFLSPFMVRINGFVYGVDFGKTARSEARKYYFNWVWRNKGNIKYFGNKK